jgi:beta-galactosidase
MILSYLRFMAVLVVVASSIPARAADDDPFLSKLYDSLHDSPMQRKIRDLAPMPFGVVFLPWKGMTEQEMREHFRLMKKLGFHNLKQTLGTPEWTQSRVLEVALEEGVIPFWYGEAGWEAITPELLAKLDIPANLSIAQIRTHPKMLAYQREVLRKGIQLDSGRAFLEGGEVPELQGFTFQPDPFLRKENVRFFLRWLKENYASPREVADAWNQYEVGISARPFQTWEDVERGLDRMAGEPNTLRGAGGEYGSVRDVLRFKAEYHAWQIRSTAEASHRANPNAPTRTGGEMGLFLPFAYRATNMEALANTQLNTGSFYPSIHFAWHFGEVNYEVARPIYMQVAFAADQFKGGWSGAWESTGGPQQLTGAKGWNARQATTTAGFTVNAGTITQLFLSYLAGGFKGAGVWAWNYRRAGWEGGEYALLDRNWKPGTRAIRAGKIAQAAERLRDELWQSHKEPVVGVLYNWDSDAIWAATSLRGRDHFREYPMQARVGVSRALIDGNIPWEHVLPSDLEAGLGPRYQVIYMPAQMALGDKLLAVLTDYVSKGGRLVIDAPGGMYDEHGLALWTREGTAFEKLFGVEISDVQYSNNVPRYVDTQKLDGFILELQATKAKVLARFQTGEPAVTEHRLGKGTAVVLAFDASFACFAPGNTRMESRLRHYTLGTIVPPYASTNAVVYRLAAPAADHYFFINDGAPTTAMLDTRNYRYESVGDPVTGAQMKLGAPIALEGYSGRWLRFVKAKQ